MKQSYHLVIVLLIGFLIQPMTRVNAQTEVPVVHAVLFYSPTCGHCEFVITQTLLPMMDHYGSRLQLMGLDVTQTTGQVLFGAALDKFGLEGSGVPFLVIGNIYLVGSKEIPERFPGLVETYLSQGGLDWPDIPGLREVIQASSQAETATAAASTPAYDTTPSAPVPATISPSSLSPTENPNGLPADLGQLDWRKNFLRDPLGNSLSVLILGVMLGSVIWAIIIFRRPPQRSPRERRPWIIPVLCLIGLGVAGYLAYVETAQVDAVCGPVGDCNTVQQSAYARLFGILPMGVLGLFGYAAIFAAWLAARSIKGYLADLASLSLFGMALLGTFFSIYLTFLEPFVIGATCAWCLTSAILMTMLLLLSARPAKRALSRNPFAALRK